MGFLEGLMKTKFNIIVQDISRIACTTVLSSELVGLHYIDSLLFEHNKIYS